MKWINSLNWSTFCYYLQTNHAADAVDIVFIGNCMAVSSCVCLSAEKLINYWSVRNCCHWIGTCLLVHPRSGFILSTLCLDLWPWELFLYFSRIFLFWRRSGSMPVCFVLGHDRLLCCLFCFVAPGEFTRLAQVISNNVHKINQNGQFNIVQFCFTTCLTLCTVLTF